MEICKKCSSYDPDGKLARRTWVRGIASDYTYDAAGRRTAITKTGCAFGDLSGSVDSYSYNARSELTSAHRTKNGQPIPGFSEDFDYGPIGNRRSSATYNEKGEAQTSTYEANNLNQYTSRTTPGYAAVRGEADPSATVTVNENPTFRLGSYYFGSDLFDNSTAGGLANLETYATLSQTAANGEEAEDLVSATTNQVYIAQSPETFAYDDDGNQTLITTKTGRWRVTYNGENRPICWVRDSDNTTLAMSYDYMGRRRMKNAQRFFYDEYLQVADNYENAYIWDATDGFASRLIMGRSNNQDLTYVYDGNKNVSGIVALCGMGEAHCEYDLFGGIAKHQRTSAIVDSWRFSCEYFDDELDVSYYNFRPYSSLLGRWLGRDETQESAGANLYAYLFNAPSISFDCLGLLSFEDIQWEKLIDVSTGFTFKNPLKFSVLSKFEELTIQLNGSKEDENCCFKVGVAGFLSLNLISTRELFPEKLIGSIAGLNPADWGRIEGGVDVGGSVKVCRCNRKWQVQKPSEIYFGVFVKGSIGTSSSTTRGYNRFSPSVIMPTFHIPNMNPMVKGFWASAQLDGKIVFEVDPFRMNQSESGVFFSASAGYRIGIWSAQWNIPAERIFP